MVVDGNRHLINGAWNSLNSCFSIKIRQVANAFYIYNSGYNRILPPIIVEQLSKENQITLVHGISLELKNKIIC